MTSLAPEMTRLRSSQRVTVAATAGADSTYDDGDEMSDAGSENSEPLQIGAPPPPANAGSNPWAPLDQAPPP